jgi:hypothetical protein
VKTHPPCCLRSAAQQFAAAGGNSAQRFCDAVMVHNWKGLLMRLLKAGLVQLLLIGALSLASVSPALALELPDVHVLSGETYPTAGEGKIADPSGVADIVETELGERMPAKTMTVNAEFTELSSLGPMTLTFTGVEEVRGKTSCNTTGDSAGTVKIPGEYHVVDTSVSPLTAAILILFKELVAECNSGKIKVKIRSPNLIRLEKVTSGGDVTEYGLVSNCTIKGKAELREYLNDEGKPVKGVPSANFGLGFEVACMRFYKELIVKSSKMIDFLF